MIRLWIAAALAASLAQSQTTAPLKIVVIEGEGAVNIIQQKTAVAPVIEVRDRNDQPVAGATVNFAIRAGRATFSGARTLTVTTNAAGRAAAAGLAPSGTGALQIGATATFQGQTAAAVTIAQTNVMTAAQAAAAATGAGAGGGGGVSGTTLGVIGGAVAGGALVATQLQSEEPAAPSAQAPITFGTTVSSTYPVTFGNVGSIFTCTNIDTQSITVAIKLDSSDPLVSGAMSINGDDSRVPGTCPPTPDNSYTVRGKWNLTGPLSGTRDNLSATVRMNSSFSTPRNSGDVVEEFSFTGALSGDTITGVLTFTTTNSYQNSNGDGRGVGSTRYDVILTKR
jgi:hypothetical protein